MTIRPGEAGQVVTYVAGRFGADDSYIVNQVGGVSPFGGTLCGLDSDYFVELLPDGSGRSWFDGRPITSPNGNGKAWYIRDQESGEVWSAFHGPVCVNADENEVSFAPGVVTAHTLRGKIASTLTVSLSGKGSCELWHVKLQNRSATDRVLTFTTYVRPRAGSALECKYIKKDKSLVMRRPLEALDSNRTGRMAQDLVFFHSSTLAPARYQIEKPDFIGEGRTLRNPLFLEETREPNLEDVAESPVACLTVEIELPIEGEAEFGFCFGAAHSVEDALEIVRNHGSVAAITSEIGASRNKWKELSSTLEVDTQDCAFDAMINTWLPYESSADWVREHAGTPHLDPYRAADSLRCLAPLFATAPELCRENLLNFAARLTVMGAYHPDGDSQVTLPPDELLWLTTCTAKYVAETGDTAILSHSVPLKDGPALTLGEHCERAIRACMYRKQSDDTEIDLRLLEQALRLWSFVAEDADEFTSQLETVANRRAIEKSERGEHRSLPRRAQYLQSLSPSISTRTAPGGFDDYFDSHGRPAKDSGSNYLMYSALVESIMGMEATTEGLLLKPNLPESWIECKAVRRYRGDIYNICVKRSASKSRKGPSIVVDGEPVLGEMLPFFGDGKEHSVEATVG